MAQMDAPYEVTFADVEGMAAAARAVGLALAASDDDEVTEGLAFERRVLSRLVCVQRLCVPLEPLLIPSSVLLINVCLSTTFEIACLLAVMA